MFSDIVPLYGSLVYIQLCHIFLLNLQFPKILPPPWETFVQPLLYLRMIWIPMPILKFPRIIEIFSIRPEHRVHFKSSTYVRSPQTKWFYAPLLCLVHAIWIPTRNKSLLFSTINAPAQKSKILVEHKVYSILKSQKVVRQTLVNLIISLFSKHDGKYRSMGSS